MNRIIFLSLTLVSMCLLQIVNSSEYNEEQIPKEILEQIIKRAEKDWPDSYGMQQRKIKWECEDYLKVKKIKNSI